MKTGRRVLDGPAVEPISLEEAKSHLREDGMDQDAYIEGLLIPAAREYVEAHAWRALITQTWVFTYPCFGSRLVVPMPPLQEIDTVEYYDADNALVELDPASYLVDTESEPAVIVPVGSWPVTYDRPGAVRVEAVVGYGDEPSDVPTKFRQAMLLLIGHWYANRESVVVGTTSAQVEQAVDALIDAGHARELLA
jgi:uncharacterized phiE125 gp8 family phage protein